MFNVVPWLKDTLRLKNDSEARRIIYRCLTRCWYIDYGCYWENRLVCASVSRRLLPKRNRQHRTLIDVSKTNVFKILTFAIKRIWHRHVYPASRLLSLLHLWSILRRRVLLGKYPPPLWHTFSHLSLQCPGRSILILLFRNENFKMSTHVNPSLIANAFHQQQAYAR